MAALIRFVKSIVGGTPGGGGGGGGPSDDDDYAAWSAT